MLTTFALGLLASIVAEVVTWLNKKFNGTVLDGKAAWLLAAFFAILGACIKVLYEQHVSGAPVTFDGILADLAEIWAIAQVFFLWVIKFFGLDVQPTTK